MPATRQKPQRELASSTRYTCSITVYIYTNRKRCSDLGASRGECRDMIKKYTLEVTAFDSAKFSVRLTFVSL